MPELPEVETTVRDLKEKVLQRTFLDAWTDTPKIIKRPKNFTEFKKKIKNKKIKKIWRRGKNIIFNLSSNLSLLIHQKMTGHLLYGSWKFRKGKWVPETKGPLEDKMNSYIRLVFFLNNNKMVALSDLRKFAKVELWKKEKLEKELRKLGLEPLSRAFSFKRFKEAVQRTRGKVKQVLMRQEVIAGIGNIYSDEALWRAKIHPERRVDQLTNEELKRLYNTIRDVLRKGVKLGGESISDYRKVNGKKGEFDKERKVYRREGEKCQRCGAIIKRVKIGGRSAHFCPVCQK